MGYKKYDMIKFRLDGVLPLLTGTIIAKGMHAVGFYCTVDKGKNTYIPRFHRPDPDCFRAATGFDMGDSDNYVFVYTSEILSVDIKAKLTSTPLELKKGVEISYYHYASKETYTGIIRKVSGKGLYVKRSSHSPKNCDAVEMLFSSFSLIRRADEVIEDFFYCHPDHGVITKITEQSKKKYPDLTNLKYLEVSDIVKIDDAITTLKSYGYTVTKTY